MERSEPHCLQKSRKTPIKLALEHPPLFAESEKKSARLAVRLEQHRLLQREAVEQEDLEHEAAVRAQVLRGVPQRPRGVAPSGDLSRVCAPNAKRNSRSRSMSAP